MQVDLLIPGLPAKADHFLFGICSLMLLRDGKRTILFDTGPYRVRPMLVEALAAHGLAPEQIDTVFVSHLHWDHIENIDLFRHAEILVPRLEFEYAAAIRPSDWGTPPYAREMLHGMRIALLDEREQEIFPGVRTIPLPGHSVGLQGLVVKAEDGDLVLASDALWSARDAVRGHQTLLSSIPKRDGKASNGRLGLARCIIPATTGHSLSGMVALPIWLNTPISCAFRFSPTVEISEP
jgi:glyoxylase-like metal-dependent hydrolase (beta-lactamase superfamily II)